MIQTVKELIEYYKSGQDLDMALAEGNTLQVDSESRVANLELLGILVDSVVLTNDEYSFLDGLVGPGEPMFTKPIGVNK